MVHLINRFLIVYCLLFLICVNGFSQLKVMTYNIRYDNAGDSINSWSNRILKMETLLNKHNADIIGFQEVLNNQLNDLEKILSGFGHAGVGRDDGKIKGEFSPIFFRESKFKCLNSGTFWLSPTPNVIGSVGWDAAITRICTYVKLKEKETGKVFFVFNTHFDHIGDSARMMSAKLIIQKINELAKGLPVILTGDFNSEPDASGYKVITNSAKPVLSDTYSDDNSTASHCTFKGFEVNSPICKRIDYIFITHKFEKLNYKIIDDNDGSYYTSDHLAVTVELSWKK